MNPRRVAVILALSAVLLSETASAASIALREGGSTVLEPLFRTWARDYAKLHPEVTVTAGSGGDGTADAFAGHVDIGAADAFMSDAEARSHPGFVDIALANSAVAVIYHLPEPKVALKLDGPTLAAIYRGVIRSWDDQAIAELNPDVTLPHHDIVPVRRAEGAGETFAFEQYLATAASEDDYGTLEMPNGTWDEKVGLRTSVALPSYRGALAAPDDDDMVEVMARTPYAIGYVAFPFIGKATQARLGTAALRNHADEFLLPDVKTINAAAAALTLRTPVDERMSLVDAPGNGCYPLVTYEYAVVATSQPDEAKALAIRDFLNWAIGRDVAGFERIEDAHLVALRSSTWLRSLSQIDLVR